ncbi:MAG: PVC-type heme-binding CxxCH protein [Sphingobacteriaceae bacterium]
MKRISCLFFICCFLFSCANRSLIKGDNNTKARADQKMPKRAEVLFLGHTSKHHDAGKYAPWLAIELFKSGINLTYTTNLEDLNTENLRKYDGLVIYANHDSISPSQESALKDFVQGGKGLIPLHSASGCFKNSAWYINAIGGQFLSHGNGTFTGKIVNPSHPVMQGVSAFETTDETYLHQKINPDMVILMERQEGNKMEPYTWVRKEGKGRVFYTAYGHDDPTWKNGNFLKLVRNGVLWAIGDHVKQQITDLKIPSVSIYPDTIANFTARHLVPKIQPGLTPEESMKLIQVPADFDVKLFAAEPDITNPIAMAWDERGRLWIVESVDYPNTFVETDGAANDRIKICEDTNGDGKADKFTVFADSLNIPTSIVFSNGGVIISMAPNFVFLKDTNGDDKADIRENMITGFGKNDTHAGPSNLQYGFDNKIWGVLGYAGFNGTIDGKTMRFGQGVYHFNPDGKNFEYLATTSNNTWGLGFSEDNNVFVSTANDTHAAYFSMPIKYTQHKLPGNNIQPVQKIDGHYDLHAMTPNLRQVDVVGGFTAAAGTHFYTARNFPKSYWNRVAFVSEPTARLIHQSIIEPNGAGFKESDGWNFMASSDEWVGPVHAEVGPDGAVWVADWYNFVIQHNTFVPQQAPTEFILPITLADQKGGQGNALESNLRDLDRGRVYRVVYKKATANKPLSLSKSDLQGLMAALENDNMFWRMTAQRLLVESKNQAALPGLYLIINNQKVDEIGLNSPAVHALWSLHGLGVLDGSNDAAFQVVVKALSHPAAGVRKAAVDVLSGNPKAADAILKNNLINDANLNVRKSVFLAIAAMPPIPALGKTLYTASLDPENEKDEWLAKALLAAAVTQRVAFIAAAPADPLPADDTKLNFTQRITKIVTPEMYLLDRGNTLSLAPDVTGKELFLKSQMITRDGNLQGVIAAQGGKSDGYALYIQDGKVNFVINQDGKSYKAVTKDALPEKFGLVASLTKNGLMNIEINDEKVASAKAASLFKKPLTEQVRVGLDLIGDHKIGEYADLYPFKGDMQNAWMELKDPAKAGATFVSENTAKNTKSKGTVISIKVVVDMMQYDKKLFTVKAGEKVTIDFENPDGMTHNMVIIKPGTLQKVGAAADAMLSDPKASQKNYVPSVPEVITFIHLVNPGESAELSFTVPDKPGDYPFVCTFPGHWRGMNGIMRVTK